MALKITHMAQGSNFSKIRKVSTLISARLIQVLSRYMKSRIHDSCKESGFWINTCHPNILELLGVNIDPRNEALPIISELMENWNIMHYGLLPREQGEQDSSGAKLSLILL